MIVLIVFPARAGMSPPSQCAPAMVPGFPRPRGDEPRRLQTSDQRVQFSPPARG